MSKLRAGASSADERMPSPSFSGSTLRGVEGRELLSLAPSRGARRVVRVGINARALATPHLRGWTRYTLELLRHLAELDVELVLLSDQPCHDGHLSLLPPGSFRLIVAPRLPYVVWEQAWLPVMCARERVEIFHAPANFGLPLVGPCPSVLTLHDAIDVAYPPDVVAARSVRQRLVEVSFWAAKRAARRIITVSEHARADITRLLDVPAGRITVIPEASRLREDVTSEAEEQAAVDALGLPEGRFFLYAGGFEARKNVELLVAAYESARVDGVSLVVVGSNPPDSLRRAPAQASGRRIFFPGFVSDLALAGLYRRALAFVYPSLYEGFGLQICEAMSFGCPTFASNATSLPEVLGTGGETFSPTDPASLATLLTRVAADETYRSDLAERARVRSLAFSWRKTAELTRAVYAEVLRERR